MELVDKSEIFLASESELRNKEGFCCHEKCFLKVNLPVSSRTKNEKELFFFFDKEYHLVEKEGFLLLNSDEEIFLFKCNISLYKNSHVKEIVFYCKRISFELDEETSTYYLVGSKEFEETPIGLVKKIKKEAESILV